jgi:Ferritin-like domain
MHEITTKSTSRRSFLVGAVAAGAGLAAGTLASFPGADALAEVDPALAKGDRAILVAASIAEALAITTYTHITQSGFFSRLDPADQGYIRAARQEEMAHYLLEKSLTGSPTPYKTFYYPKGMFHNAQTTLNTLVTLEEAFIAAYLVGVRNFSTATLRVAGARIMGIESDHRSLARSLSPAIAKQDGGPITHITGIKGVSEPVEPPNNNGYERTLGWTDISQAVTALTPFISAPAAAKAGFDSKMGYPFQPFTPTLPSTLGGF